MPEWLSPHDPGRLAWIIVATYAIGFVLALAARSRTRDARERRFWLLAATVLLLLGLNKQLDLQTDIAAWMRTLAQSDGWYTARRNLQLLVFAGLAVVAVLAVVALRRLTARARPAVRVAQAGLVILAGFVLIRAASFQHVDRALRVNLAGIRVHSWLELAGIAVIAAGAAAALVQRRTRRRGNRG